MFSLANVLHLFPDELARLRRWRFSFAFIFPSSFNRFLLWHNKKVSRQYAFVVVTMPADFRID